MARADPSAWLHQHARELALRSASPPSAADGPPDALKSSKCCYYYITVLYHAIAYYTTCYYIDIHVDIDDADNDNDINGARCFSSAAPRQSSPEVPGPRWARQGPRAAVPPQLAAPIPAGDEVQPLDATVLK